MIASMMSFVSSGPMRSIALLTELKVADQQIAQLPEADRILPAADGLVVLQDAIDDARIPEVHVAGDRQAQQLVADGIEVALPGGVRGIWPWLILFAGLIVNRSTGRRRRAAAIADTTRPIEHHPAPGAPTTAGRSGQTFPAVMRLKRSPASKESPPVAIASKPLPAARSGLKSMRGASSVPVICTNSFTMPPTFTMPSRCFVRKRIVSSPVARSTLPNPTTCSAGVCMTIPFSVDTTPSATWK